MFKVNMFKDFENASPESNMETVSCQLEIRKSREPNTELQITTKCDFIVLSQVNEISLTVNQFH